MGVSTGTPCCDAPITIGPVASLGIGPIYPPKMCGNGTSVWNPGYQIDNKSDAIFVGNLWVDPYETNPNTSGEIITVNGGITFNTTYGYSASRGFSRPSDIFPSNPNYFAIWAGFLDNATRTQNTIPHYLSADVTCDGNLTLWLSGYKIGIQNAPYGIPSGPMQVAARGQIVYTFGSSSISGSFKVKSYLVPSGGSFNQIEELYFNGNLIASYSIASGVGNGTPNWGGFRDYTAMRFDITHYSGSSSVNNITYTVGNGETLVKDTFDLSADNEDWIVTGVDSFTYDNTGASPTAGYGTELRISGVRTESIELIEGALYRLEFDIDDRYSIPFIAHNNAVFNKASGNQFNWAYTWGGTEIPYNTGEFHPDDICGYYFIAETDNVFRLFGRIDESANVSGLKIFRVVESP